MSSVLREAIQHIRYPHQLVYQRAGVAVGLACSALVAAFVVPGMPTWWLKVPLPTATFPITYLLWWIGRELYWRSGRDRKVGVCFDGHRVPIEDIAETVRCFRRLAHTRDLRERIALRFLPATAVADETALQRTLKRFGLAAALAVNVSQRPDLKGEHVNYTDISHARGSRSRVCPCDRGSHVRTDSLAPLPPEVRRGRAAAPGAWMPIDCPPFSRNHIHIGGQGGRCSCPS